jgi:hypothetical protein
MQAVVWVLLVLGAAFVAFLMVGFLSGALGVLLRHLAQLRRSGPLDQVAARDVYASAQLTAYFCAALAIAAVVAWILGYLSPEICGCVAMLFLGAAFAIGWMNRKRMINSLRSGGYGPSELR